MGDQQQQQIQQPLVVYPNTFSKPYPGSSSSSSSSSSSAPQSHSSGSFGTVFIVLAVILVLSALACVFGRLCNRSRAHKHQSKAPKQEKASKKVHEIRPVEREPREGGGDLEFGFDPKRMPKGKPLGGGNGGDIEFGFDKKRAPPNIKHGVRFKLPENGDFKGDTRHGGPDIEFRPGR